MGTMLGVESGGLQIGPGEAFQIADIAEDAGDARKYQRLEIGSEQTGLRIAPDVAREFDKLATLVFPVDSGHFLEGGQSLGQVASRKRRSGNQFEKHCLEKG